MSNNLIVPESSSLPYYVATYLGRAVAIKRDPDYQTTVKLIQKSIAKLRGAKTQDIVISTSLADYGEAFVQISEEIWPDVVDNVKIVEVTLDELEDSQNPAADTTSARNVISTAQNTSAAISRTALTTTDCQTPLSSTSAHLHSNSKSLLVKPSGSILVTVRTTFQNVVTIGGFQSTSIIRDIKHRIEEEYLIPVTLQQLELSRVQLDDMLELGRSGIVEGAPVDLILRTRSSVIYLPPTYQTNYTPYGQVSSYMFVPFQDVTIQLSVNRNWELAALRPYTNDLLEDYVQSKSWTVDVTEAHVMFDHDSDSKACWLHWDGSPSSQSSSLEAADSQERLTQLSNATEFYQSTLLLKPSNSVAVAVNDVNKYNTNVFSSLGISRNEFLCHFLSQLGSKPCSHVAIRFLPQAEYQKVASLSIPDHSDAPVIHITLLYKRIDATAASLWDSIAPFYRDYSTTWKDIIDPGKHLRNQYLSQITVIDFTFLEVF